MGCIFPIEKPHCKRKRKKDGNTARRASILSQNAVEGTREREREREKLEEEKKLEKKRRRRRRSLKGEGVENQSL